MSSKSKEKHAYAKFLDLPDGKNKFCVPVTAISGLKIDQVNYAKKYECTHKELSGLVQILVIKGNLILVTTLNFISINN